MSHAVASVTLLSNALKANDESGSFSAYSFCMEPVTQCYLYLTLYTHIKTAEQRTIIQQYGDWSWPLMGRLLYLVQRGWAWGAGASPSPLIVVPNVTALPSTNVTALPSTASVPTSYYLMWHYNCLWKTVNSQPRLIAIRCLNE